MNSSKICLLAFFCLSLTANSQTNIYFESGSFQVDAKGKEALKKMVDDLSGKEVAVLVRGYTDTTGTVQQNLILARKREAAVTAVLSEYGINASQIGVPCSVGSLHDDEVSNATNRRVSVTIDELIAYTAKNGSIVMAPKHIKLRIKDKFYQPNYLANKYRNKQCRLPLPAGKWYSDVAIESETDSCNFIVVKVPDSDNGLPVLYLGNVKYENHGKIGFRSYATSDRYKLFRVPIYSSYIALDQYVLCGHFPRIYLDIVLPKTIRPIKAHLGTDCLNVAASFKKDTLRVEYDEEAQIDWRALTLSVKTRDTLYKVPMWEFEVIYERKYSGGMYVVKLPEHREPMLFREKKVVPKRRRTFWQRLGDLFR